MIPPCECGLSYVRGNDEDEALHRGIHDAFMSGPSLPELSAAEPVGRIDSFGIVRVSNESPQRERVDAAQLALVANREMSGYKSGYDGSISDPPLTVWALLDGERAIGFVLMGETERSWRLRWVSPNRATLISHYADSERRHVVARVWIAASYRRQGLARQLLHFCIDSAGTTAASVTFQLPFTPQGQRLVHSMLPDQWFGDGDAFDLDGVLRPPVDEHSISNS